jgi:hypothetical protein
VINKYCWDGGYYFDSDVIQDGRLQVLAHFQPTNEHLHAPQILLVSEAFLPESIIPEKTDKCFQRT